MSETYPDPDNIGYEDDVPIEAPDVVPPSAGTPGNIPTFVLPETEIAYHSYELDITDTALVWQPGAPIDTGSVRQYLVDRGYEASSVDVQIGDDGRPTGILTVRTNPLGTSIYPPVDFTIADAAESSTTATVTAQVKLSNTAIATLPDEATFAGEVTFAAAMRRSVTSGEMGIVPVVNGVDGAFVGVAGDEVASPVSVTLPVTGLVGGTAPTFGLKYRGAGTAGTTVIADVTITGRLVDGMTTPVTPITPAHWAEYDGTRYEPISPNLVDWGMTGEAAHVTQPDADRLIAFWQWLEGHGVQVDRIEAPWNLRYPETAPDPPDILVYAYGAPDAIPSAVIANFIYSALPPSDRDAFEAKWDGVTQTTTIRRTVRGQPDIDDYQYSGAMLWIPPYSFSSSAGHDSAANAINVARAYQVGRQRKGDLLRVQMWEMLVSRTDYYIRYNGDGAISGGQYLAADYEVLGTSVSAGTAPPPLDIFGNAGSLVLGERAFSHEANATVLGVAAEGDGENSVVIGTRAKATHRDAVAIGVDAESVSTDSVTVKGDTLFIQMSTPEEDRFFPYSKLGLWNFDHYDLLESTPGGLQLNGESILDPVQSWGANSFSAEIRRLLEAPFEVYRGKGTQEDTGTFGTASNPYLHLINGSVGTPPHTGTYEGYVRYELFCEQLSGDVTTLNLYPQVDGTYQTGISRAVPGVGKPFLVAASQLVTLAGEAAHTTALGIRPASAGTTGNFRIYWSTLRGSLRRIA